MNLCLIPARGGSKRIPRKNIRDFFGLPVMSYSIQTAHNSALFDFVMVSTDDDEIAQVAYQYGAEVHRRSPAASTDTATDYDVIKEVLKTTNPDCLCLLYPVAPLVESKHLIEGYNLLMTGLFPVPFIEGQFYWVHVKRFREWTSEQYYEGHSQIGDGFIDVNTLEDWERLRAEYMVRQIGGVI